ncbi:hypothetical protein INS49_002244 [Diaporthe citri]|uniref:uncharacterized protein n=1 Tax=Diaporthe citri TaxID=83186 RepID=UPI001C7F9DCC|nr:uncharacterized protein INS49_002244 [Diaporthe citri]KAG6368044.1 hypothetical protein INS49_002244 [Diaporthe citri]
MFQAMISSPTSTSTTSLTPRGLSSPPLIATPSAEDKAMVRSIHRKFNPPAFEGSILAVALEHNKHDIVELLLARRSLKIDSKESPHPLMIAMKRGAHVRAILARDDIDINGYFDTGDTLETPLTMAAKLGRLRIVESLLNRGGIDVNKRSNCAAGLRLSA